MKTRFIALILIALAGMGQGALALSTSYYTKTSVLSTGHWVKVSTPEEGIYQFTYDQLRDMGFANPEQVQVYGYGAMKLAANTFSANDPDDLVATPTMHTSDGRILFFGQGNVSMATLSCIGNSNDRFITAKNYYDTQSHYFLTDAFGVSAIPAKAATTATKSARTNHIHLDLNDLDLQNPINGGVNYHGAPVSAGANIDYDYHIKNFEGSTMYDRGSFCYFFAISETSSKSLSSAATANVTTLSTSNSNPSPLSESDYTYYSNCRGILYFQPADGVDLNSETVTFTVTVPSTTIRYAAPDYVVLRYPRANVLDADNPYLIVNYGEDENEVGRPIQFTAAEGELAVWSIDNTAKMASYPLTFDSEAGTATYVLSESNTRRSVAFNPTLTFPTPSINGVVANQNLHGLSTPDMLIIATADMMDEAERLAAAHRTYQGLDVVVAEHNAVFNEFSSGSRDAMGYRRLAKMFYDRNSSKFKYLLFLGQSLYDNRCIQSAPVDRLVTYQTTDQTQSSNIITNYAGDMYFAALLDSYRHSEITQQRAQIAVGRIPAISVGQARTYVDKAIAHLSTPRHADVTMRAMAFGGSGDLNAHLQHAEEVSKYMVQDCPDITCVNVHSQLYDSGDGKVLSALPVLLKSTLQDGVGYFSYSGHGGPTYIEGLDNSIVSELKVPNPPFVMFSSCDQFAFDRQANGLMESMLFSANGGMIAGIGAVRSVYINYNQLQCLSTARAYAQSQPGDTYGDIFMRTRDIIIDRYQAGDITQPTPSLLNCMSYNLAGDPALPAYTPQYAVAIESVAGNAVDPTDTEATPVSVKPMVPFHVCGTITDGADFNGTAIVKILATPVPNSTYNTFSESSYTPAEITQEFDVLTAVEVTVNNGAFDATITAPIPANSGLNRLIVTAYDTDGRVAAIGSGRVLQVLDYDPADPGETATGAPEILDIYLDQAGFENGGETTPNPTIVALINPSSAGIALGNTNLSTHTSLLIDNGTPIQCSASTFAYESDDVTRFEMPLSDLSEGIHTATLTVVNNIGEVDRATIDFVVVTRSTADPLTVAEVPARTVATIDSEAAISSDNRLIISDAMGNTVFSATNVTLPYEWNLKDNNGNTVGDGRYQASILSTSGRSYGNTATVSFIVLK